VQVAGKSKAASVTCYARIWCIAVGSNRVPGALQSGFRIGDFDVYPQDSRIAGPSGDIRVQPKLIDVLLCLAEKAGKTVSRLDLHKRVWGDVIVTDDALNRCISELRRILGDKRGTERYIETLPKRGYRLLQEVAHPGGNPEAIISDVTNDVTKPGRQPPIIDGAIATVAVLPFESLTPDSANAFLATALPTAVHCGLTRLNRVRVASRRLSFALPNNPNPVDDHRKILEAQYIVSGSVAEASGRIRVIAEVEDVTSATLLWSQRYEVDSQDVLAFEQHLTETIIAAFGGQRLKTEIRQAQHAPASQLGAWGLVQRARAYLLGYKTDALERARKLTDEATTLDPGYAFAQAMHALVVAENVMNGLSGNPQADYAIAREAAQRALHLAPTDPAVLRASGCAMAYCGDYEASLETLRHATQSAPYDFGAWGYLGWPLAATGKTADIHELLGICARLLELAPRHPGVPYWHYHKSVALAASGDTAAALEAVKRSVFEQPEFALGLWQYANLLGELDRPKDAAKITRQATAINGRLDARRYADIINKLSDQQPVRDFRLDGLLKAGII
jgi:DNA-binding winged helix-turn-helix (wHTH) protein/tetratricopeptide (TPR) repeat protein